jgi:ParB family transcriptional regulator, chromosome partitioning protein
MSGIDAKKRRLGRGLSGLLGEPVAVSVPATEAPAAPTSAAVEPVGGGASEDAGGERVARLAVGAIVAGPYQPRRRFDDEALAELAASIKSAGLIQPVLVRPIPERAIDGQGGTARYELVAGERRWRAAQLAGLAEIPAIVAPLTDEQAAEWSLIENVQRQDLGVMERADAVRNLCATFALTQAQAAERLGMSRPSVANLVRLTELEPEVRALLEDGRLSAGHGKALLAAPAGKGRAILAQRAADAGWSVRKLEEACAPRRAPTPTGPDAGASLERAARLAGLVDIERQIGEQLGTKVRLRADPGGKRGSVVIMFYDLDHFDGLMAKMGVHLR